MWLPWLTAGYFSLFVAKRFRGNRIGTCLLHNAVLAGGRRFEVAVLNVRAIAFYKACGWRRAGESFEDIGGMRSKLSGCRSRAVSSATGCL
ncbi:N-acetyltransferase family protein [Shinella sp. CPCC 101442]|uniref:GNAT family N-acetyltransferase n=1 Tax=Shinella sp. CPCC 101442 TaxID=2932265 RepID=UPI0035B51B1E